MDETIKAFWFDLLSANVREQAELRAMMLQQQAIVDQQRNQIVALESKQQNQAGRLGD